jgi:hypothetical protein
VGASWDFHDLNTKISLFNSLESMSLHLTPDELLVLNRLGTHFYAVVAPEYRTYCAFTSRIAKAVLDHYGVPCELQPCQMLYSRPDHIHVVGFLGQQHAGKWDGHVVCRVGNWLLDTALHHFEREFQCAVPWVVAIPRFSFPTQALAKWQISATDCIWWQQPPQGMDPQPPHQPESMVSAYADRLIERIAQTPH